MAALLVAALLVLFPVLPVLLAVAAVLAVGVAPLQRLLSRQSFSAVMARNTP